MKEVGKIYINLNRIYIWFGIKKNYFQHGPEMLKDRQKYIKINK